MLKGEKVILRPLKKSDIEHFLVWMNDPEVIQYLLHYSPLTEIKEERWFEKTCLSDSDIVFVIEAIEEESNKPIGNCGLHRISFKDQHANFGIVIGDKEYWNRGCGTEAIQLIIEYGFKQLNLNRISSSAISFNERSCKLHRRAGFQEEGRRPQKLFVNGQFHDEILFGLLREDWLKR